MSTVLRSLQFKVLLELIENVGYKVFATIFFLLDVFTLIYIKVEYKENFEKLYYQICKNFFNI